MVGAGLLYLVLEGHGDLGGPLAVPPARAARLPLVRLPEPLGAELGDWGILKISFFCVKFSCLSKNKHTSLQK